MLINPLRTSYLKTRWMVIVPVVDTYRCVVAKLCDSRRNSGFTLGNTGGH